MAELTFQQECLRVHNDYRKKHQAPDLVLNPKANLIIFSFLFLIWIHGACTVVEVKHRFAGSVA